MMVASMGPSLNATERKNGGQAGGDPLLGFNGAVAERDGKGTPQEHRDFAYLRGG